MSETPISTRLNELIGSYGLSCSETKELAPTEELVNHLKTALEEDRFCNRQDLSAFGPRDTLASGHPGKKRSSEIIAEARRQRQENLRRKRNPAASGRKDDNGREQ